MDHVTIVTRLFIAGGLGLIIGYERELHGRPAGLRTNMVVTVGSCLLMIISLDIIELYRHWSMYDVARIDPGRIASYAVAGMGFIGAGAIIQGRGSVRGLTSAASLWACNAVGLAVGAGFYVAACVATLIVLFVLLPMRRILSIIPQEKDIDITLLFDHCLDRIDELLEILREYNVHVLQIEFSCEMTKPRARYDIAIRLRKRQNWSKLQATLRKLEGLTELKWSQGHVP